MSDQTVDLNSTQCLRDISEVGFTTVQNICSGATHTVPWGLLDWLAFGFLGSICAAIAVFVVFGIGYLIWTTVTDRD